MSIDADLATELAAHLLGAQTTATAVTKLTDAHPDLDVDGAYLVQNALRALYLDGGHHLAGWKAGLTSRAKMEQMGVDRPTVGFLTDRMAVSAGSTIDVADLVHPRVEPEVAFVLAADLPTSGCTVDDVLASTAHVVPAIEVIDSRYENFRFDLPSVIADNSSSARFVVGTEGTPLDGLDRAALTVTLSRNGEEVDSGLSSAVMEDPAAAVALVADIVGSLGGRLEAGMTVLSGGVTAALAVSPGDLITATVSGLGSVEVRFA